MRTRAYIDAHAVSRDDESDLPGPAQVQAAVSALILLADPTRLRMLCLLSSGEHDVGTLAGAAGATPPAASQHLAKLRLAGLVDVRQDGKRRLYSTRGGHVRRLVEEALYFADHRVSGEPDHG
ncbi:MAG: ArsR/SmtB family transcription factor [Acidimicrobiales bacterium]